MKGNLTGFRLFVEDQTRSLNGDKGKKAGQKPENLIDGMWRELGIDPNTIPDFIESGPIEFDGVYYNQAIWRVVKPIDVNDNFVKIQFHKSLSPNLNQHAYVRKPDGSMQPFGGTPDQTERIITLDKLAEMLGRPWQQMMAQGGAGAGAGAPPPMG